MWLHFLCCVYGFGELYSSYTLNYNTDNIERATRTTVAETVTNYAMYLHHVYMYIVVMCSGSVGCSLLVNIISVVELI